MCTFALKFFKSAQLAQDGTFKVIHIPGAINPADVLTKVLPVPDYQRYRDLLCNSKLFTSTTVDFLRTVIDLISGKVLTPS